MNRAEKRQLLRGYLLGLHPSRYEAPSDEEETLAALDIRGVPRGGGVKAVEAMEILFHSQDLDRDLTDEHVDVLEAIVLPAERPVFDIRADTYETPPSPFEFLGLPAQRRNLEAAIPAVGRIDLPGNPRLPFAGTGFLVGEDILMTNRHVAELFASGLGRVKLSFLSGASPEVDFKREIHSTSPSIVKIRSVLMIHPYWDMALLRTEELHGRKPLQFATAEPGELSGRDIAVLGYPAKDPRNDAKLQESIFRGTFNVKRLQPGRIRGRETVRSFGNMVRALTHDSSTLGGNSGSAVIDPTTGKVVGLHFAGAYLKANYAVPAFELARDKRVVDSGLSFDSRIAPHSTDWDSVWATVESAST